MTAAADYTIIYFNGNKINDSATYTRDSDGYYTRSGVNSKYNVSKSNDNKLGDINDGNCGDVTGVTTSGNIKDAIGAGTIVEAFLDKDTNVVTICIMSVYAGKVTDVKDATATKDAYVVIECGDNFPADIKDGSGDYQNNTFDTTDFAVDDVVAFTYSDSDHAIKTMYKMESVEGTLTSRVVTKSIKLGDTSYSYAQNYSFDTSISEGSLSNKSSYVVYLDDQGNALYIEESSFGVDAYAYVEAITETGSGLDGNVARLVLSDGSKTTVNLDKNYFGDYQTKLGLDSGETYPTDLNGSYKTPVVVRYNQTSSGDYKLTLVSGANSSANTETAGVASSTDTFRIYNHNVSTSINYTSTKDGTTSTYTFDSNTIFVVKKAGATTWTTYTGIKNVPNVSFGDGNAVYVTGGAINSNGGVAIYARDGVAKLVYIDGAVNSSATSKNVTFVATKSASKMWTSTDDTVSFYAYNAVVNGKVTTIYVNAEKTIDGRDGATATLAAGAKETNNGRYGFIFDAADYNNDDESVIDTTYYNNGANVTVHVLSKVKKVSDTQIELNGAAYDLASNCAVYEINKDGDIEEISVSTITTDSGATAYYTVEDGEITNLFIYRPTK
jgi:hypothetical protein